MFMDLWRRKLWIDSVKLGLSRFEVYCAYKQVQYSDSIMQSCLSISWNSVRRRPCLEVNNHFHLCSEELLLP